ncbi:hypothetical protein CPLU01_05441 [Colletotrichum plurivorum]|uniref:Uncharacterized protein n=1 Tax=Colletotrichum plurivorum TaxID=2175906 RepID=A0A8H6KM05_9PEZI|nr:hypothetical protein CPLU01_05441 [Colletotrichum plurivorum]
MVANAINMTRSRARQANVPSNRVRTRGTGREGCIIGTRRQRITIDRRQQFLMRRDTWPGPNPHVLTVVCNPFRWLFSPPREARMLLVFPPAEVGDARFARQSYGRGGFQDKLPPTSPRRADGHRRPLIGDAADKNRCFALSPHVEATAGDLRQLHAMCPETRICVMAADSIGIAAGPKLLVELAPVVTCLRGRSTARVAGKDAPASPNRNPLFRCSGTRKIDTDSTAARQRQTQRPGQDLTLGMNEARSTWNSWAIIPSARAAAHDKIVRPPRLLGNYGRTVLSDVEESNRTDVTQGGQGRPRFTVPAAQSNRAESGQMSWPALVMDRLLELLRNASNGQPRQCLASLRGREKLKVHPPQTAKARRLVDHVRACSRRESPGANLLADSAAVAPDKGVDPTAQRFFPDLRLPEWMRSIAYSPAGLQVPAVIIASMPSRSWGAKVCILPVRVRVHQVTSRLQNEREDSDAFTLNDYGLVLWSSVYFPGQASVASQLATIMVFLSRVTRRHPRPIVEQCPEHGRGRGRLTAPTSHTERRRNGLLLAAAGWAPATSEESVHPAQLTLASRSGLLVWVGLTRFNTHIPPTAGVWPGGPWSCCNLSSFSPAHEVACVTGEASEGKAKLIMRAALSRASQAGRIGLCAAPLAATDRDEVSARAFHVQIKKG